MMTYTKRDTTTFEVKVVGTALALAQVPGSVCAEFIRALSAKQPAGTRLWAKEVHGAQIEPAHYYGSLAEYEAWLAKPPVTAGDALLKGEVEDESKAEEVAYTGEALKAQKRLLRSKAARKGAATRKSKKAKAKA